ncbi:MAG: YceI family protein [Ktedonobacteraceae bacterium]|nr:YceI family protein [Ktedonobacteraceae bacterium]MBO0791865.1 YceI family protein [Ktedonobacteraceae bacterium]
MSWTVDAVHSQATFSVKHMMVSTVKGQFKVLSGSLNIDEQNPANSWVQAEVDAASIDTRDENRDNHLRSADFFDAASYPKITFKSTKVEPNGNGEYKVSGELSMHGVTKPAVFEVEYAGQSKDPWGNQRAGLSARTKVSRKEWGLTWNQVLETGGFAVSDDVKIEIDLSAIKQG